MERDGKSRSKELMLAGMETKFSNIVKRIDADINGLMKSKDALDMRQNTTVLEINEIKTLLTDFITEIKEIKPMKEKDVSTILMEGLAAMVYKCINALYEYPQFAIAIVITIFLYNILSILSFASVCMYMCEEAQVRRQKRKDAEYQSYIEFERISLPPPPPPPSPSPSPPPLPCPTEPLPCSTEPLPRPNENDIVAIAEIVSEPIVVDDALPPKPPMRTFSLPKNYKMKKRRGLPTKEEFQARLKPVSSPVLPRAPLIKETAV